jgi:hypothetical protein
VRQVHREEVDLALDAAVAALPGYVTIIVAGKNGVSLRRQNMRSIMLRCFLT